ncbi:NERD domain-containing protein [Arthrobacter sp. D1-29]
MTENPQPKLLRGRIPAQAVIEELLDQQGHVPPRTTLQRIFGASPLSPDTWPWYKGALGEIAVGKILERLGREWLVLHAVPVGTGSSDIDHILVGPAGVFTVNTKNHSGQSVWVAGRTFMVAGQKTRHLYNAEHEAERASRLLSTAVGTAVDVVGIVVVVNPKSLTVKTRPKQVAVLTDTQLLGWLNRCRRELPPEEVAQIASAAVLPGTWHRKPAPQDDRRVLEQNFEALRQRVNQARRRRAAWVLGVPAAGFVMLANGTQTLSAILHSLGGR